MARNQVEPYRDREVSEDGKIEWGPYRVDGPDIPLLVARGVMPFRFMRERSDFETRFAGCETPADVGRVILGGCE